jgi:hypothetical protein
MDRRARARVRARDYAHPPRRRAGQDAHTGADIGLGASVSDGHVHHRLLAERRAQIILGVALALKLSANSFRTFSVGISSERSRRDVAERRANIMLWLDGSNPIRIALLTPQE